MSPYDKLCKARTALLIDQPFFGSLALYLSVIESTKAGDTMATDGTNLYYNAKFVDATPHHELKVIWAHEVMHCACLHQIRRGQRDAVQWNKATDYAINQQLKDAGFTLPQGALIDPQYKGLGAEEIFSLIGKEPDPQGNGQSPQGSGSDPGGCGAVLDAGPAHEPSQAQQQAQDWQEWTTQAVAVAKGQNAGTVPGHLARIAEEIRQSQTDWREILRRFIDQSMVRDFSWSRPNRRFVHQGIILPGYVSDSLNRLVVVVDTSGSIDQSALAAFRSEIAATLDEGAADHITVVYCDTSVTKTQEFERGDAFEMNAKGGGGTAFSPAFKWIEEHAPDAAAIVYLTDLDCDDYGPTPSAPVIWATYGDPRTLAQLEKRIPFGETIRIKV